jgi:pimeloyl-ACP methyl ester carboxylesterase
MGSHLVPATVLCCAIVLFGFAGLHGQSVPASIIPYGDNKDAGNYAVLNGVNLYYEIYGIGNPLVLIHGNGGNIAGMKYQIEYFARSYKVIAIDCRGRGKSELGKDSLTYMQMTGDVASLLDYLHLDSAYVIGRSDGGIIGLLMGIYFPLSGIPLLAGFRKRNNLIPECTPHHCLRWLRSVVAPLLVDPRSDGRPSRLVKIRVDSVHTSVSVKLMIT